MENFDKTMKFNYDEIPKEDVKTVLQNVYHTLEERGYNPVNKLLVTYYQEILRIFHAITKLEIKFVVLIAMISWKN